MSRQLLEEKKCYFHMGLSKLVNYNFLCCMLRKNTNMPHDKSSLCVQVHDMRHEKKMNNVHLCMNMFICVWTCSFADEHVHLCINMFIYYDWCPVKKQPWLREKPLAPWEYLMAKCKSLNIRKTCESASLLGNFKEDII